MLEHPPSCVTILPLIPAQAGIQKLRHSTGSRFRGDERIVASFDLIGTCSSAMDRLEPENQP